MRVSNISVLMAYAYWWNNCSNTSMLGHTNSKLVKNRQKNQKHGLHFTLCSTALIKSLRLLCPKLFTGIEEHCSLVEDRSKLSKSDEKWIMRFYFNLRMNDLPLRNRVCIAQDSMQCSRYNSIFLSWGFSNLGEISPNTGVYVWCIQWGETCSYPRLVGSWRYVSIP